MYMKKSKQYSKFHIHKYLVFYISNERYLADRLNISAFVAKIAVKLFMHV